MAIKINQKKYAIISTWEQKIVTGNRSHNKIVPMNEITDSSMIYIFGNETVAQKRCDRLNLDLKSKFYQDLWNHYKSDLFVVELHCEYTIV